MATIRIILKTDKTTAKGEHPIALRLADANNKRVHFYTGFYSTDKFFDTSKDGGRFFQGRGVKAFTVERKEEGGAVKLYSNKEANEILSDYETRAKDILKRYAENHINWSIAQFRDDFENKPNRELFYAYAYSVIESEYQKQGRYKKAEIAKGAIKSFERYDKDFKKKTFTDITSSYIQGYVKYCSDQDNSDNTIAIRLREIRRVFNIAIRDKVIPQEVYPFSSGREDGKVRIPKTPPNRTNKYLTVESLYKLESTSFENHVLERTKRLFLFSYYSRGMNWKDMALLRKSSFYPKTVTDENTHESKQVTMMEYRRSKTKGQFEIQVTDKIQKQLDWFKENTTTYSDYVLPIIQVDVEPKKLDAYLSQVRKRFNHSLRDIAKALELPESQLDITSYTSRHSFAMTMQTINKPVEVISQALGHQSLKTTEHYLERFSSTRMAKETDIDLADIMSKLKEKNATQ